MSNDSALRTYHLDLRKVLVDLEDPLHLLDEGSREVSAAALDPKSDRNSTFESLPLPLSVACQSLSNASNIPSKLLLVFWVLVVYLGGTSPVRGLAGMNVVGGPTGLDSRKFTFLVGFCLGGGRGGPASGAVIHLGIFGRSRVGT